MAAQEGKYLAELFVNYKITGAASSDVADIPETAHTFDYFHKVGGWERMILVCVYVLYVF